MLRTIIFGTVILAGAAAAAQADVYRWVDDHGSVHYSDQWVPGSQLIKTTHTHPAASSGGASQHDEQQKVFIAGERASLQVAQEANERSVKQDVAKAREQQCKEAKDRYSKVIQARRIYKTAAPVAGQDAGKPGAEAERQWLSDEEADNLRLQAHTEMVEACGSAAK